MPDTQEHDVNADRITVGMKVMGGILLHAIMLVIFFMSLKSQGEKNAEGIQRNNDKIAGIDQESKLKYASFEAQIAAINVRLAVLENQNAERQSHR